MNGSRLMIKFSPVFLKFVLVGLTNTIVSWIAFVILNMIFSYQISYVLSYSLGLVVSYILNGKWTFSSGLSYLGLLLYPFAYIFQFAIGYFTMGYLVESFSMTEWLAYTLSLGLSVPVGFICTRRYFQFIDKLLLKNSM